VQKPSHSEQSHPDVTPSIPESAVRIADELRQSLNAGASRCELLTRLASAAEALAGRGAVASILVLDRDGLLRNGASPNLPADYLSAIDRLKPEPNVGTCAAAAATGVRVITPDFLSDDKWAELRHLPRALGFVGAWSMPIRSADGKVLGTFGTYYRERRTPTADEQAAIEVLAAVAAEALAHC
jgi:GAF domain-containing protein